MEGLYPPRKFAAPEFVFGIGARRLIVQHVRSFSARRVFLVTDPGVITAGWAAEISADFNAAGIRYLLYSALSPNPRDTEVMNGAEIIQKERCSMIVAVGGGRASLYAGLTFSNSGLGAVHALAHSLGGLLAPPHGECNALLLCAVIDFNFPAIPERYRTIADAFGINIGDASDESIRQQIIAAVDGLTKALSMPENVQHLGVRKADIPSLAENALHDACMATNPRIPHRKDIEAIYARLL